VTKAPKPGEWWIGESKRIYYKIQTKSAIHHKKQFKDNVEIGPYISVYCHTPNPTVKKSDLLRKVTDQELIALAILFPDTVLPK